MNDVTKPNFMRYQRVATLVTGEAALKDRLGSKTETVLKPNGDKVEFAKEVVDLTERIHAAGFDANALNKQQILQYAVNIILWGDDGGLPPVPQRTDAEVAAPDVKKRAPAKVKKVRKPKAVEKKAPAPEAPPAEQKPAPAPEALPAATKPKPAAPETANGVRQVTVTSPPSQCVGTNFPYAVGCAAGSLIASAIQLLEIHDKSAEGKEIQGRLNKVFEDVLKRTTIPNNTQSRA